MIFTLDATQLTYPANMPAKAGLCKVATTGTWAGTLTLSRTIRGESADYIDGEYTENTDFYFSPGTDITTFTFDGTGEIHVQFTRIDKPNA